MELDTKKLKELKDKEISIEDLDAEYFIEIPKDDKEKIEADNILKLLNENICSFEEIVDKCKSIKDSANNPCLYEVFSNKELFKELIENNRLNEEDLRYLLSRIDEWNETRSLSENTSLLKHIVENELFEELIDKFKKFSLLLSLVFNKELFEELIQNNRLNKEDLRYLLDTIDNAVELYGLCENTPLIKYILNEFVLNKELVDKFSRMFENEWRKKHNIHTIFEYIQIHNKDNEEILKLNELNKKVCLLNKFDLSIDQRLELIEVLKDNEIALNRLIQIVNSNLENNYDFNSLMRYLNKKEKKNILNI